MLLKRVDLFVLSVFPSASQNEASTNSLVLCCVISRGSCARARRISHDCGPVFVFYIISPGRGVPLSYSWAVDGLRALEGSGLRTADQGFVRMGPARVARISVGLRVSGYLMPIASLWSAP